MKLVHRDAVIGTIMSPSQDGPWMSGTLAIRQDVSEAYYAFFEFMTNEDQGNTGPPFSEEFLDEDNWFVVDEDGTKRGIEVPAVHDNDFVMWRWR